MEESSDQFELDELQKGMNSYDWSPIDVNMSPLPKNPNYQVTIEDPQSNHYLDKVQKYYRRFRHILENQDTHFLPQALALSTYLLKFSTNNYYALMLRRKFVFNQLIMDNNKDEQQNEQILKRIKYNFERQLNFTNNLLEDNPKEYHIWTYKKELINKVLNSDKSPQSQLQFDSLLRESIYSRQNKFIFSLLIQDCRNYHAWDYRFWLVTFLGKIQLELQWVHDLIASRNSQNSIVKDIKEQISNSNFNVKELKPNWINVNSLWSHKFNLIKYLHTKQLDLSMQNLKICDSQKNQSLQKSSNLTQTNLEQLVEDQIFQSTKLIEENNQNECLWNYLKGMLNFQNSNYPNNSNEKLIDLIKSKLFKVKSWEQTQQNLQRFNRFELSFLKSFSHLIKPLQSQTQFQQTINSQLKIIDNVRAKYYDYLERKTENK